MRSPLIPFSLIFSIFDSAIVYGLNLPVQIQTTNSRSFHKRANGSTIVDVGNYGNAQYYANMTIGGVAVSVLLDTGSSDLWVNFPDSVPSTTNSGKSLTLEYAIGSIAGSIVSAPVEFCGYSITSQDFLLVTDTDSFSTDIHKDGYDGLVGLGPNEGSNILDEVDGANSVLTNIFTQTGGSDNFITLLLNRNADPAENFTAQLTISELVPGYDSINSQPKIDVETVHKLLDQEQHWQALTDANKGIVGPDGEVIQYDSIVPKAPDGQLVAVFDSGFTFSQVPRTISDAIYGRVQGAVYDSTNQWWTVPCGQLLNVSFNFGGQNYPVHPLDTVDDNFGIKNANGTRVCIGTFQPITSAFSLLGNYDMIMGMNFLRNVYTKFDYGDWSGSDGDSGDPYMQILSITNVDDAKADFVQVRMGGTDTTGDSEWWLLSTADMQHSPLSPGEKKKEYEEMILSRWPYIFVGCLAAVLIITGLAIWRCCCRRNKDGSRGAMCCHRAAKTSQLPLDRKMGKTESYLPLQDSNSAKNMSTASLSGYPQVPYRQNSYQQDSYQQKSPRQESFQQNAYQQHQQDAYQQDSYQQNAYQQNAYQQDAYHQQNAYQEHAAYDQSAYHQQSAYDYNAPSPHSPQYPPQEYTHGGYAATQQHSPAYAQHSAPGGYQAY